MAVLQGERRVMVIDNMENDIVVGTVVAMMMVVPVRGVDMYLHIANPKGLPYSDVCIGEVRPTVAVEKTGALDNNRETVDSTQLSLQQLVLPYILEEGFVHAYHIINK